MSAITLYMHPQAGERNPRISAIHNGGANSGALTIRVGGGFGGGSGHIVVFTENDAYAKALAAAINAVPHPADEVEEDASDDTVGDAAPLPIVKYYEPNGDPVF